MTITITKIKTKKIILVYSYLSRMINQTIRVYLKYFFKRKLMLSFFFLLLFLLFNYMINIVVEVFIIIIIN